MLRENRFQSELSPHSTFKSTNPKAEALLTSMNLSKLKKYLAPVLLMVIASCQMVAVHFAGFTRWEGGGFGMYSELPPLTKHVVIRLSAASESPPQEALAELERQKLFYQTMPSDRRLERIADILRHHSTTSFRIEAWAERFNLTNETINLKRIGQVTQDARGDQ